MGGRCKRGLGAKGTFGDDILHVPAGAASTCTLHYTTPACCGAYRGLASYHWMGIVIKTFD